MKRKLQKYPLAWHADNVKNMKAYRRELSEKVDKLCGMIKVLDKMISNTEQRIAEAEKNGILEIEQEP